MDRLIKNLQALVWPATIIAIALVWAYSSFATINYVDTKHQGVLEILNDIRDHVKMIDERTYELAQRRH